MIANISLAIPPCHLEPEAKPLFETDQRSVLPALAALGRPAPLAIMGAMTEEIALLIAELTEARVVQHGNQEYHCGKLWGCPKVHSPQLTGLPEPNPDKLAPLQQPDRQSAPPSSKYC